MVAQLNDRQKSHVAVKVQHVKSYLETYYGFLEEYENIHGGEVKHTPVDGTWNPLQIIRNRRIRALQGVQLRRIERLGRGIDVSQGKRPFVGVRSVNLDDDDWQKVKLASRVFSKHSKARNIWQVNLYEIIGDIEWREANWGELKDHNNELWFNPDGSLREKVIILPQQPQPSQPQQQPIRLHDRMFDVDDVQLQSSASVARKDQYQYQSSRTGSITGTLNSVRDKTESSAESEERESLAAAAQSEEEVEFDDKDDLVDFLNVIRNTQLNIIGKGRKLDVAKSQSTASLDVLSERLRNQMSKFSELESQCTAKCTELNSKMDTIEMALNTRHSVNEHRENKIEELLGYCDRTNGDINTSITLQIRNLIEKASDLNEGVESSIFVQSGSRLLEGGVIVLLWGVWLVVEAWICFRWTISTVFQMVKWVFL